MGTKMGKKWSSNLYRPIVLFFLFFLSMQRMTIQITNFTDSVEHNRRV